MAAAHLLPLRWGWFLWNSFRRAGKEWKTGLLHFSKRLCRCGAISLDRCRGGVGKTGTHSAIYGGVGRKPLSEKKVGSPLSRVWGTVCSARPRDSIETGEHWENFRCWENGHAASCLGGAEKAQRRSDHCFCCACDALRRDICQPPLEQHRSKSWRAGAAGDE